MKKIFLFSSILIFLFLINFVNAETCTNIGEVFNGKYCEYDGNLYFLKSNGAICINDYECQVQSCVEGVCSEKYSAFFENENLIQQILGLFSGWECTPGEVKCEGTVYFMCGSEGAWENKGNVDGQCSYNDDDDNNGGSSGSGGGIDIVIVSPKNITYSTQQILLEVKDRSNDARKWWYSLNGETKKDFDGSEIIYANIGSNNIIVYASETSSFYDEKKEIRFSVITQVTSYCGNGYCDAGESCSSCSGDCGVCEPIKTWKCGDGTCNSDESSYTCPADCTPVNPKNYWWILVVVGILVLAIVVYIYREEIKKTKLFKKIFPNEKTKN